MREIKFRGKRLGDGKWLYGSLVKLPNGSFHIYDDEGFGHPVDPNTVGQYTGLKDKNGVEIYEGDICVVTGQNYKHVFQVYWDDETAGFYDHQLDTEQDWLRWDEISVDKLHRVKVIGNIYENPELLEKAS